MVTVSTTVGAVPLNPARPHRPDAGADVGVSDREKAVARSFEAVFLGQMVDQMMKTVDVSAMSGGKQAEMWRSFMSDALAQSLADRGGLGIAASVEQMLAAYKR